MKGNAKHERVKTEEAGANAASSGLPFGSAAPAPSTKASINPAPEPHPALLQLVELMARAAADAEFSNNLSAQPDPDALLTSGLPQSVKGSS